MDALSEMLFSRLYVVVFLIASGFLLLIIGLFLGLTRSLTGRFKRKWLLVALLGYYVMSVLCYTVFCRKMGELTQFQPIPFYNLCDDTTPLSHFICEGMLNMVMFVPIGIIATLVGWSKWRIMIGAFLLSLSIETMQRLLKCGCCEMNDVINNCLGTYIGLSVIVKIKRHEQ